MTQVRAKDLTDDFLTSKGGLVIGKQIENLLKLNPAEDVELSFEGVEHLAPSFVNGAFLYLIDNYGDDYFRSRIKVINSTPDVAKTIGGSVRTYIEHQKQFFSLLKTDKVFLVVDNKEFDRNLAIKLGEISNSKGFVLLKNPTPGNFSEQTQGVLKDADVVIGVLNAESQSSVFIKEMEYALGLNKQCIVLQRRSINQRLSTASLSRIQVLYYDDSDFLELLAKLNKILLSNRNDIVHRPNKSMERKEETTTAVVAFLAIAVLVAIFFALISSEENRKK